MSDTFPQGTRVIRLVPPDRTFSTERPNWRGTVIGIERDHRGFLHHKIIFDNDPSGYTTYRVGDKFIVELSAVDQLGDLTRRKLTLRDCVEIDLVEEVAASARRAVDHEILAGL